MKKRNPNPIDVHVGNRVRMRRMLIGMSQEKLGEQLGLTFQQIQKYEKGSNRVSASRLYQMSRILGVPVQFFFDDLPDGVGQVNEDGMFESVAPTGIMDFMSSAEALKLSRFFSQIENPFVRRKLVDLAAALAGDLENTSESAARE